MVQEFVMLGAQGRNPDVDNALVLWDANNVEYKIKADSASGQLGIYRGGVRVGTAGYGSAGSVTQITSRTTGVTVNALSGSITTDATSLAAGAEAAFTVTNSTVEVGDVVVVSLRSGATAGTSVPLVTAVAAGSFQITLTNLHAATADTGASIINFAVIKAGNA